MGKLPLVSVVAISYNQEKYIGEALQSFVVQQTNFDFEVIIADDCSSDNTPAIIDSYAKAHPKIFRPILRPKNLGVQNNIKDALLKAKGKYVALCEGDDYWTDQHKLQKQIDFLESHPDYALCFHPVRVFFENDAEPEFIAPDKDKYSKFNTRELLEGNFIYTNSVVYRRQDYSNLPTDIIPVDWYLHLLHAKIGKIGFIDEVMSDYRRHPGGIWWDSAKDVDIIWSKYGLPHMTVYVDMLKLFNDQRTYRQIVLKHVDSGFIRLATADAKYGSQQLRAVIKKFPEITNDYIMRQIELGANAQALHQLEDLNSKLTETQTRLEQTTAQLKVIKSSRAWKLRNKLSGMTGRKSV